MQIVYQRMKKNSTKGKELWVTVRIAINLMEEGTSNQKNNKHKHGETNKKLFQMGPTEHTKYVIIRGNANTELQYC